MSIALSARAAPHSPIFERADRLSSIGVSEILRVGANVAALRREGRSVVSLCAGEPDFDTPESIKEAARRAIAAGATKYTALDGSDKLKEAVREKFRRENGLDYRLDEISCGAGVKQVLFNALAATLDSGDEVVVPTPGWTSYRDMIAICGGRAVSAHCSRSDRFKLTAHALDRAITRRTRWLLLNSPSNPCGSVYSEEDIRALAEILRAHPRVWIASDDIYEHILYDDRRFATMAAVASDLAERTLTLNGVSKTYAMTGWRIGFGAGPRTLVEAMAVVQSQTTSCPSSISQAAAVEALTGPQDCIRQFATAFQSRRDRFTEAIRDISGLSCDLPEGAFYLYADCEKLLGRTTPLGERIESDADFCRYLLENGVAVVPGSCFGGAGSFRLSFAASEDEIAEGLRRIGNACRRLSA